MVYSLQHKQNMKQNIMNEQLLFDFLAQHNISYMIYRHQSVFTAEEVPVIVGTDGPMPSKKTVGQADNQTIQEI